jgi:hypothetical protein
MLLVYSEVVAGVLYSPGYFLLRRRFIVILRWLVSVAQMVRNQISCIKLIRHPKPKNFLELLSTPRALVEVLHCQEPSGWQFKSNYFRKAIKLVVES